MRRALRSPALLGVPGVCGLLTAVTATSVLLGWAFDWSTLVRLGPELSAMKVNTAVCLLLLGVGLVLHQLGRERWAAGLGSAVAVVGTVTLGQDVLGVNLGIDTLVLGDAMRALEPELEHVGRMAPATVLALTFLGAGLVVTGRRPRLAHALGLGAMLIGYVSLLGYAYGVDDLHRVGGFSSIAGHTAAALVVAGVGLVCLRPEVGLLGLARDGGAVGLLVRRLAVFAVVVPQVVGSLRWVGERYYHFYDDAFGMAIMTLAWTVGVLAATWFAAGTALPIERERADALTAAQAAQQRLSLAAEASSAFASTVVLDEVLDLVTVRVAETLQDGSVIVLLDESGTVLVPLAAHHTDSQRDEGLWALMSRPLPVGEGIAGRVVQTGEPVLVARFEPSLPKKLYADPRLQESVSRLDMRSVIAVPIRSRGRILGVLSAIRNVTPEPYDAEDVAVLVELANGAAQAIDNARLVAAQVRADAALAELGRRALAARDADRLAQEAVELLARTMPARYAMLIEPGPERDLRATAVAWPAGETTALPPGSSVTGGVPAQVFTTGQPVVCNDMRHDTAMGMVEMGRQLGTDSGMAVAVPGRAARRGVLAVADVGLGRYTDEDLHFLDAVAAMLATALNRLETEVELARVAEQRASLLGRLVAAQEEEAARIANGVHDDQVQAMAALDLRLGLLHRRVAETNPDLLEDLDLARSAVAEATDRLRDLLFDLQPPEPGVGLADALRDAAAHLFDESATTWRLESDFGSTLVTGTYLIAYRIAREALVNARKHAGASAVSVRLNRSPGGVEVTVVDDGVGMGPVVARSPGGHLGLNSMYDRAAVAGGSLKVDSRPGAGTTVRLWLPLPRIDPDA